MSGVGSRAVAAEAVTRILEQGAYSNVLLPRLTARMPARDAAFVSKLVVTVVRMARRVDRTIETEAGRELASLDPPVRAALRCGVAELVFLGAPARAVIHSTVEAVKAHTPRAAGFVNAVLRAVDRHGEPPLPPGEEGAALRLGVPGWMLRRLGEAWSEDEATRFFSASNEPAPTTVRLRRPVDAGRPVEGIEGAVTLDGPGAAAGLPDGSYVFADPASVAVGLAAAPGPGDVTLDLAAAPGGKTLHLWDLGGRAARVIAMDRHPRRARSGRRRLRGFGVDVPWIVGDARRPPFAAGAADVILLDAPCTGLGTLRRRPEVRHRLTPDAPQRMGAQQRQMLQAALALDPRRLVYAVCTVFPEETVEVVAGLGARPPEGLPGRPFGDGLLLTPHETGTDGMFIAVFDLR